jgi:O-antigen ligase
VQSQDLGVIYNHAHDDYAEIAATTGASGFAIAIPTVVLGFLSLFRLSRERGASWRRRAFMTAALTSILVALIHALIDFNFYIPANPTTLAAIAGAAVATRSGRGGERGSASSDSPDEASLDGALPES